MKKLSNKQIFSIKDIAQIGIMVAVIEASKFALSSFPNIELTSFWMIMFTLYFGWKVVAVVPVFILIEGAVYGVHLWWIMYLYAWPLLVLIAWLFKKNASAVLWAVISGIFGLCFGALCSIPYFVIGASTGGFAAGIRAAVTWWIAGLPFDFIHCAGNFVIMLVLYKPVSEAMKLTFKTNI
jgi:energy-coupling factor transport system substrate-specific component